MTTEIRAWKKGFTLVEIIAALVVIIVISMGFLARTIYVKRNSVMMQQKMIAWQLIDQKFSSSKLDDGETLVLGSTSEPLVELRNGVMTLAVTKALPDDDARLKQVVATVGWDLPWRDQEGPCNSTGDLTCDKQESAVALFYKGY